MVLPLAKVVLVWLVLATCCRTALHGELGEWDLETDERVVKDIIDSTNAYLTPRTSSPRFSHLTFGRILPADLHQSDQFAESVRQHLSQETAGLVRLGKHLGSSIFGLPWPVQWNDAAHVEDYVLLLEKVRRGVADLRPVGFAYTIRGSDMWLHDAQHDNRLVMAGDVQRGVYG